mmetsp:Transcript_2125/g.3887  ORF Transcript_2125/g.3887 Transcript_2125/m.3887 type:complete len:86 (+) Transcript_2125:1305-1562(+)
MITGGGGATQGVEEAVFGCGLEVIDAPRGRSNSFGGTPAEATAANFSVEDTFQSERRSPAPAISNNSMELHLKEDNFSQWKCSAL